MTHMQLSKFAIYIQKVRPTNYIILLPSHDTLFFLLKMKLGIQLQLQQSLQFLYPNNL